MLWGVPVQVNPALPDGLVILTDYNPITGRRAAVATIVTACQADAEEAKSMGEPS